MERLSDEVLLQIFSFLPPAFVFRSISFVCRRFSLLAYNSSPIHRSRSLLKDLHLYRMSSLSLERLLSVIIRSPSNFVERLSVQECDTTWQLFEGVAVMCKDLKILNLPGMNGFPNLGQEVQPFVFHKLLELNVSGTKVGDIFINQISKSCKQLYSLNISHCPNITDMGLLRAKFNLMLLNMAHCNLRFPAIVHIV